MVISEGMLPRLMRIQIYLLGFIFLVGTSVPAQQLLPSSAPTRLAIKAGRLIDVRTGNVATNVFIVIEKDRIVDVGSVAPNGIPIIDLSRQTVLPGLIDVHVHSLLNWTDQSSASVLRMSSAQGAL